MSPSNYHDNKHNFLQLSIFTVEPAYIVFAAELTHGLYFTSFSTISPLMGQLSIYNTEDTKSASVGHISSLRMFLAVISLASSLSVGMPFNLPTEPYSQNFEEHVFIDRLANLRIGDPKYFGDSLQHTQQFLGSENYRYSLHDWFFIYLAI